MHALVWALIESPYWWRIEPVSVDTFIKVVGLRGPGSPDERPPKPLDISFYRFRESMHAYNVQRLLNCGTGRSVSKRSAMTL
jgi:hypothetical protein